MGSRLDREVMVEDRRCTVARMFPDKLSPEIPPGRVEVPKAPIYAEEDPHADDLVQVISEEFGKGNDFCQKIAYRTTGASPEQLVRVSRLSYHPRMVVTVDRTPPGRTFAPRTSSGLCAP